MNKKTIVLSMLLFYQALGAALRVTPEGVGSVSSVLHNLFHDTMLGTYMTDNVRTVAPGRLYRCGMISPQHIEYCIDELGLKAVINLDGAYSNELKALLLEKNVALYDYKLSLGHPSAREFSDLLGIFDQLEGPVLVHCRTGVYHTGFVCALWLIEKEGRSLSDAQQQFSFWQYGFRPYFLPLSESLNLWSQIRQSDVHLSREVVLRAYDEEYVKNTFHIDTRRNVPKPGSWI